METLQEKEEMKTIAVINQKGGVGKTTLTANLGAALAVMGKKILLIDLDPQANLTYSFGLTPTQSISEVILGKKTLEEILLNAEYVSIAPSARSLADTEDWLVSRISREGFLKTILASFQQPFDYCLIDCPPSLSSLTLNALNAASEVLIPLQMEVFSMEGLNQVLDTIHEVKRILNPELEIMGIIPSMFDARRRLSGDVLERVTDGCKERVFKTHIRECVKIAEAPSHAQTILSYAPTSRGAEDFKTLAEEFLNGSR